MFLNIQINIFLIIKYSLHIRYKFWKYVLKYMCKKRYFYQCISNFCKLFPVSSPMGSLLHGWVTTKTWGNHVTEGLYTDKKCIRNKGMCKVSQYTSKYFFNYKIFVTYSLHIRYKFWKYVLKYMCKKKIFLSVYY